MPDNSLTAGTGTEPALDSMAKAMVDAFLEEWPNFMKGQEEPSAERLNSLRHIFVAASRGLIKHLAENPGAFQVDVTVTGEGNASGNVSEIRNDL